MISQGDVAQLSRHWEAINRAIVDRVKELSQKQLNFTATAKAGSDWTDWPIWAILAHTAGARVYWLCGVFKQPGAERTPFPKANGYGWEDEMETQRSADEVVWAMESSWNVVADWLARWSPEMLQQRIELHNGKDEVQSHQALFMRLSTHDGYHAGEVSLILGVHGLPGIDPWRQVVAAPL
jgi:hypothetical protein